MDFNFNIYSTPLLFGFAQAWIYAVLFWLRGQRTGRLSDVLFGCLLVACAFEVWEYLLGFGGIGILWQELEMFPRNFGLLLPPLAWWYLQSQFNADFRFSRREFLEALPFLIYLVYHLAVFAQGADFVQFWMKNWHNPYVILLEAATKLVLQIVFFYKSFRLYRDFRYWANSQFSNTETVSFAWFRNFLLTLLAGTLFSWVMQAFDWWLDLDFWHEWWDLLFVVGLIYYLSIEGYAQSQRQVLHFQKNLETAVVPAESPAVVTAAKFEKIPEAELQVWKSKIEQLMLDERPWLDPELSLADLARRLQTNGSVLSAVINAAFGKNFNDFVNEYRVEAVKGLLFDPSAAHLSLLGIGLECGFNSKSTFNRAFRKSVGVAPSEFGRVAAA